MNTICRSSSHSSSHGSSGHSSPSHSHSSPKVFPKAKVQHHDSPRIVEHHYYYHHDTTIYHRSYGPSMLDWWLFWRVTQPATVIVQQPGTTSAATIAVEQTNNNTVDGTTYQDNSNDGLWIAGICFGAVALFVIGIIIVKKIRS